MTHEELDHLKNINRTHCVHTVTLVLHTLATTMQVPLQLGAAVCSAAQHSPTSLDSPALLTALTALTALSMLLRSTVSAGLIKKDDTSAAVQLVISLRQQLQQSGVLPQLSHLMTALAADLLTEAAALGRKSREELHSQDLSDGVYVTPLQQQVKLMSTLYPPLRGLWRCSTQAPAVVCRLQHCLAD